MRHTCTLLLLLFIPLAASAQSTGTSSRKTGISDTLGNTIIPAIYTRISTGNAVIAAWRNDTAYLFNKRGKLLFSTPADDCEILNNDFIIARRYGSWAILDSTGANITRYKYNRLENTVVPDVLQDGNVLVNRKGQELEGAGYNIDHDFLASGWVAMGYTDPEVYDDKWRHVPEVSGYYHVESIGERFLICQRFSEDPDPRFFDTRERKFTDYVVENYLARDAYVIRNRSTGKHSVLKGKKILKLPRFTQIEAVEGTGFFKIAWRELIRTVEPQPNKQPDPTNGLMVFSLVTLGFEPASVGLLNEDMQLILPVKYTMIDVNVPSKTLAAHDGKLNYFSFSGRKYITVNETYVDNSEPVLRVQDGERTILIDSTGIVSSSKSKGTVPSQDDGISGETIAAKTTNVNRETITEMPEVLRKIYAEQAGGPLYPNGKVGCSGTDSNIFMEPHYDTIYTPLARNNNYFVVKNNGRFALVNSHRQQLTPYFDSISINCSGLDRVPAYNGGHRFKLSLNNNGTIDSSSFEDNGVPLDMITEYLSMDLVVAKQNNKRGLYDMKHKKWLIAARHDAIYWNDGAIVATTLGSDTYHEEDDTTFLYTTTGKRIFAVPGHHKPGKIARGFWSVNDYGESPILNQKGKVIVPGEFTDAKFFGNGFIVELRNGNGTNIGIIDTAGSISTPPIFNAIEPTDFNYMIGVKSSEDFETSRYSLINPAGSMLTQPIYSQIKPIRICNSEGQKPFFFVEKNNRWGLMDGKGKLLLPCKYKAIEQVYRNKFVLLQSTTGKWGVMNISGKAMTPFIDNEPSFFCDGYFLTNRGKKAGWLKLK